MELGTLREDELCNNVWQKFLTGLQRAAVVRLQNMPSSALYLVRDIVDRIPNPIVLRLQHRIVDRKKSYKKTDAGLIAKPRAEFSLPKAASLFRSFIMSF
jgi:hypothetical protein